MEKRESSCIVVLCLATQLCPTLCNPMDCRPPGFSVHGILQARTLERVDISSTRGSSRPRDRTLISCICCIGRQILYRWATREAPPYSRCLISDVCVTLWASHFTKPSKLSVGKCQLMLLPLYPSSIQQNLFSCSGVGVKPRQNFVCEDVNPFHRLPWQLRSAVADWVRALSRLQKAQTLVHIGA